jgi:monothiol glutaredoxin
MKITAYLKPSCGWSNGVRAILKKYQLDYEDKDILNCPENYAEMIQRSGQTLSPCVEIDGVILSDVSGEEVENYLLSNELVQQNDSQPDSPVDQGCDHSHLDDSTIRFF